MTSIIIQSIKGGVGKTTTAIHLAAGLASQKSRPRVLLIDSDQQSCVKTYFRPKAQCQGDFFDFFIEGRPLEECILPIALGKDKKLTMDILPATRKLADVDIRLSTRPRREETLRLLFHKQGISEKYDYVLFDCPPALNLLTYNITLVGQYLIVPCAMDFLSLMGVQSIRENLSTIESYFGHTPHVLGLLPTFVDNRTTVCRAVMDQLKEVFGEVFPLLPEIRCDAALKKAQIRKQTVFQYQPRCRAAEDYQKLVEEVLKGISESPPPEDLVPASSLRNAAEKLTGRFFGGNLSRN